MAPSSTPRLSPYDRRVALRQLSRDRLLQLCDHYSLHVQDRRKVQNCIDVLVRARRVDFAQVLSWLKREELQDICNALSLDSGGREKEYLVQRILSLAVDETEEPLGSDASVDSGEQEGEEEESEAKRTQHQVFIVHGHDNEMKAEVARFVDRLGLEAVILHEQPNLGRTIIEKLERYATPAYVCVLLSPDDMGYSKSAGSTEARPRARQNVILELGMFIGKLGRERVAVLYKGGVELPSDVHGLVYMPYHGIDSVKGALAREMKAVGLNIDMTKIF